VGRSLQKRAAHAAIGDYMLPGFIGIVLDDRAIVMVVVRPAQRVHRHVRHFVGIRECLSLPSKGKGLPQDGEQHQGKGELAAHRGILIC
jgi:hypothetical protein